MIESVLTWWRTLAQRERRVLLAGTLLVVVALIWLLAFEPAWRGRARLADELPVQREKLAKMASLVGEARRLEQATTVAPLGGSVRSALEKSLAAAGLAEGTQIEEHGDRFELRFKSVPFAPWLDWVALNVRETRVRVVDVRLTRDPRDGRVAARISFQSAGAPR